MPFLYRTPVIVWRRQPYVDWANSLGGGDPKQFFPDDLALRKDIYLGPYSSESRSLSDVLDEVWMDIFEEQLNAWSTDERQWPESRTRAMFDLWFGTEQADSIVDLDPDEPLTEDDMDRLDVEYALQTCAWCGAELGDDQGREVHVPVSEPELLREREGRVLTMLVGRDRVLTGVVVRLSSSETDADGADDEAVEDESVTPEDEAADHEVAGTAASHAAADSTAGDAVTDTLVVMCRACSRPCEKRLLKALPPALHAQERLIRAVVRPVDATE